MEKQEFYWSIAIEPGWVQAGLWSVEDGKAKVYQVSHGAAWDSFEDLLHATDAALSSLVDSLPDEVPEPSRTVFGVSPSWVDGGQIKEEQLKNIKNISDKLSLKPGGFVVLPEGIAHMVKAEEGSALNAVLVGLYEGQIDVTLFRLGNLVGSVNVVRSVSIEEDVMEGLVRFGESEPLPSRFLLYDGREAELSDAKQALMNADWEGRGTRFLHAPKVEIITPQKKVVAISLAGAFEMMGVSGVVDKDEEEAANVEEATGISAEEVGFVVGEDVSGYEEKHQELVGNEIEKKGRLRRPKIAFPKIPRLSIPSFAFVKRGRLSIAIVVSILLLVGGGVYLWKIPTAEISLYVNAKPLDEIENVVFEENLDELDVEGRVVGAKLEKVSVLGVDSKSTTGKKVVGERASGEVEVRNGTSQSVRLDVDELLGGASGEEFRVLSAASVSAALSPSEPGSVIVEIEALEIGAEYNLSEGTSLSVSNFPKSEVDAVVASGGLSGGASREIQAVSQEDIDSLEKKLFDELQKKGELEIKNSVGGERILISDSVSVTATETNFSGKVGDEADTVDIELAVQVSGISILKEDMSKLASSVLAESLTEGFLLRPEQISYAFELVNEDDGVWEFEVRFTTNLLPTIDLEMITEFLAGATHAQAERKMKDVSGYSRVEVNLDRTIPVILERIPWNKEKIHLEVVAEK